MVKIVWTELAIEDLRSIHEYISKDSKRYADRHIDKLIWRAEQLENNPNSGRVVPEFNIETTRELIEGNYRIIYKVNPVNQSFIAIKLDHVYMHLVESAPFNKGRDKVYSGIPGNLVAFACILSFQRGFEGNVSFVSKTQLIKHYTETLEAFHAGGRLMIIETGAALRYKQIF